MVIKDSLKLRIGLDIDRSLFLCVALFLILNAVLYAFSVDKLEDGQVISATYWNASDGQRYWGAAVNLATKGEFTVPSQNDEPLSRAGPLPALFFAIPMYIVGFDRAPALIVASQCFILLLMGLMTSGLAKNFNISPLWSFALVIFNPNLIGLAHHGQSDLLFSFIFLVAICIAARMIRKSADLRVGEFVVLGIVAGCLALTRGVGQYYAIFLPFFLICAILVSQRGKTERVAWRKILLGIIAYCITWIIVTTPWAIRNHIVLEDYGLTQSEAIMMRDQYRFMLRLSGLNKEQDYRSPTEVAAEYLTHNDLDPSCVERFKDTDCKSSLSRAYLQAIVEKGLGPIAKGLGHAWVSLFFSSSASRIANYVGLNASSMHSMVLKEYEGARTFVKYAKAAVVEKPMYAALLFLALVFATVSRVLGLLGIYRLAINRPCQPLLLFLFLSGGLLVGAYMFVGISRYRAPLEPMLMLLTVAAWKTFDKGFKRKP